MQDDPVVAQPGALLTRLAGLGVHPTDGAGTQKFPAFDWQVPKARRFEWGQLIRCDPGALATWVDCADDQDRIYLARTQLIQKLHRHVNSIVFSRSYFSLEEAGIGYATIAEPDPAKSSRMAAVLRILSDLYRVDMDQYRGADSVDPWQDIEAMWSTRKVRSLVTKLAAHLRDEDSRKRWFWGLLEELGAYGHRGGKVFQHLVRLITVDSDASYFRCKTCGRVHLHVGLGNCTRCGGELNAIQTVRDLRQESFLGRRVFRHEQPFRLSTAELTGQTKNPADRQRRFRDVFVGERQMVPPLGIPRQLRDGIDLLAVTTTMEVGIDIGSLRAVLEGNMSPQRFNYQQRVGRAGRRGQGFAYALTICRSRSHDLHYFRHPESITGDEPPPPFLTSSQPEIPARLLRKFWLADAFGRFRKADRSTDQGWIGDFVSKPDFHGEFIETAHWRDADESWSERLRECLRSPASQEVLKELRHALTDDARNLRIAQSLENQVTADTTTMEVSGASKDTPSENLAEALAENGAFPMFGMPTRTRDLYLNWDSENETWDTMDRDLDLGIFEFEPGNVLVRDKWQVRCVGFTSQLLDPTYDQVAGAWSCQFNDNWLTRRIHLFKCANCGAWNKPDSEELGQQEIECDLCGCFVPREDVKEAVTPAAFRTDFRKIHPDEQLEPTPRAPRIANALAQVEATAVLPMSSMRVSVSQSRTFSLNQGPSREGFELADAETEYRLFTKAGTRTVQLTGQRIHPDLRGRQDRLGEDRLKAWLVAEKFTRSISLVPALVNDCLKVDQMPLMNSGTVFWAHARWAGVRSAAISGGFLIVQRVAYEMDIDPDELEVIEPYLQLTDAGRVPVLRIAERASNGAGYVERLVEPNAHSLLTECLRRLLDDEGDPIGGELRGSHVADCDKACYRCLMRYGNQPWHGVLDWRLGMDWIRLLMGDSVSTPTAIGSDGRLWGFWSDDWRSRSRCLAYRMGERLGNGPDTVIGLCDDWVWAFQMRGRRQQHGPWVVIVHPLWAETAVQGSAATQALAELRATGIDGDIRLVDSFNLTRRPNRVREWILEEMEGQP